MGMGMAFIPRTLKVKGMLKVPLTPYLIPHVLCSSQRRLQEASSNVPGTNLNPSTNPTSIPIAV